LLGEDIAFIQYLEGLNLILPSSDKSITAFANPLINKSTGINMQYAIIMFVN